MLDYWKLWIDDPLLIEQVLQHKTVNKCFESDEHGTLVGIKGSFGEWKMQTLLTGKLQITGSLHKYWNGGTNENDFSFADVGQAINRFCGTLQLPPEKMKVVNLEFGLNLQPEINASEIIDQIICFNNGQPICPYNTRPDCYFIEFEQHDYYLKIYDKGKQYRRKLPGTLNTLRIEVKGMNSRYLDRAGVETVADLIKPETLQVLAVKFVKTLKGLVLDDDTINPKELPLEERRLYRQLQNPRKWKAAKGATTTTQRNNAKRFRRIVEQHGKRNIYSMLNDAVKTKLVHLANNREWAVFLPNLYGENQPKRVCATCGRDITNQHKSSKFCSAKNVGYRQAHKCRNTATNPYNNLRRKIEKIHRKGVLFDVTPFITGRGSGF